MPVASPSTHRLMRSLLFLPGNRETFYAKAAGVRADGYVVDLEDSVPGGEKLAARQLMSAQSPLLAKAGALWVRVNDHSSEHHLADVGAAASAAATGLMLPKVESTDDLRQVDLTLSRVERERGRQTSPLRLILIVESAKAAWLAYDLATASSRVAALCFGGARDGDLMTELGADWSNDGAAMLYARQRVLLAARAAGCIPLDGVFADLRDVESYERDTRLSRSLGYRGRTVVHPSQVGPANQIYSPTAAEIAASKGLLETFDVALANGHASALFEGRMIDEAMAKAARAVLDAASHPP